MWYPSFIAYGSWVALSAICQGTTIQPFRWPVLSGTHARYIAPAELIKPPRGVCIQNLQGEGLRPCWTCSTTGTPLLILASPGRSAGQRGGADTASASSHHPATAPRLICQSSASAAFRSLERPRPPGGDRPLITEGCLYPPPAQEPPPAESCPVSLTCRACTPPPGIARSSWARQARGLLSPQRLEMLAERDCSLSSAHTLTVIMTLSVLLVTPTRGHRTRAHGGCNL
jgi:hypothetical protein